MYLVKNTLAMQCQPVGCSMSWNVFIYYTPVQRMHFISVKVITELSKYIPCQYVLFLVRFKYF